MIFREQVAQRPADEKLRLIPFLPTQNRKPPLSCKDSESDRSDFFNSPRGRVFPMHGLAVPLSGRAGHRGQTGAACHLFAVEGADFGVRVARMALRWKVVRPERPQRKRRAGISTAAAVTAPMPGIEHRI